MEPLARTCVCVAWRLANPWYLGRARRHQAAGPLFRFLLSVPDGQAPLLHGMSQDPGSSPPRVSGIQALFLRDLGSPPWDVSGIQALLLQGCLRDPGSPPPRDASGIQALLLRDPGSSPLRMSQGPRLSHLGAPSCPGFRSSLPAPPGQAGRRHASLLLRPFWPELSHMAPSNHQGLQNVAQRSTQEEQGGGTSSSPPTHECILAFNP